MVNYLLEMGLYSFSRREMIVDLLELFGLISVVTDLDGIERLKFWNMGIFGRVG